MPMHDCLTLPVSSVDPDDRAYRITRAGDSSPALTLSIKEIGLQSPLAVVAKGDPQNSLFTIVSGSRRFAAVRSLKMETVACRVLPADNPAGNARLAVVENAFGRGLGPGELVRAVDLLNRHMDTKTMAAQSVQIFNQSLNRGYLDALLNISRLGHAALDLLDTEQVTIKTAKLIADMDPRDATAMIDLFSRIKASSGKQMEIITWTREIAAREGVALSALLKEASVSSALDPEQANQDLGMAANRLRACLFSRRFPELDQARKAAAARVRDLKLTPRLRLTLPENFEGTDVTVSMTVASMADYVQALKNLSALETHPSLKKILDRE